MKKILSSLAIVSLLLSGCSTQISKENQDYLKGVQKKCLIIYSATLANAYNVNRLYSIEQNFENTYKDLELWKYGIAILPSDQARGLIKRVIDKEWDYDLIYSIDWNDNWKAWELFSCNSNFEFKEKSNFKAEEIFDAIINDIKTLNSFSLNNYRESLITSVKEDFAKSLKKAIDTKMVLKSSDFLDLMQKLNLCAEIAPELVKDFLHFLDNYEFDEYHLQGRILWFKQANAKFYKPIISVLENYINKETNIQNVKRETTTKRLETVSIKLLTNLNAPEMETQTKYKDYVDSLKSFLTYYACDFLTPIDVSALRKSENNIILKATFETDVKNINRVGDITNKNFIYDLFDILKRSFYYYDYALDIQIILKKKGSDETLTFKAFLNLLKREYVNTGDMNLDILQRMRLTSYSSDILYTSKGEKFLMEYCFGEDWFTRFLYGNKPIKDAEYKSRDYYLNKFFFSKN